MVQRPRSPSRVPAALLVVALLAAASVTGCAAGETSVQDGRTHLRSVAIANYSLPGGERLDRLLDLLSGVPPAGGEPAALRIGAERAARTSAVEGVGPGAGGPPDGTGPGDEDAVDEGGAPPDAGAVPEEVAVPEESAGPDEGAGAGTDGDGTAEAGEADGPGAGEAAPAGTGPSTGLALDLALMTEVTTRGGRRVLQALPDGAVLLDGYGRVGDGDGLKLSLQPDRPSTIYVLLVDATGRPHTLFPNATWSTVGNPVQPGRPCRLPQGNVLFPLGGHRGIETLYIIASPEPWLELETLLDELEAAPWGPDDPIASVERAARITRGLADREPSTARAVSAPSGTLSDVTSVRYVARPGERLVVTRWFRHR